MSRHTARMRSGSGRTSLYDEITDKIITELEAGRVPWVQPWGTAAAKAPLALQTPCSPASSPIILFEHARTWPRDGQIWPETGCAIDRLSRNAVISTFFPWADAHSSRGNKVLRRRPPLRFGPPCGCVADRPRPVDRHRGRGGRGLENSKEK